MYIVLTSIFNTGYLLVTYISQSVSDELLLMTNIVAIGPKAADLASNKSQAANSGS